MSGRHVRDHGRGKCFPVRLPADFFSTKGNRTPVSRLPLAFMGFSGVSNLEQDLVHSKGFAEGMCKGP